MKAIILAAGRGSRMKDLTDDRPKCMVELHGKPLLEWELTALRNAGISDIAIVTGYKRELLANLGFMEFHNPRWEETNMVSSLAYAAEWLKAWPCIVSYSDIFYKTIAVTALMKCQADIAVTYDVNWYALWEKRFGNPLLDAETFRLNSDGSLADIGNKPNTVAEIEGQYLGLLRFTPIGWGEVARIRESLPINECDRMHMTGMLQKVIEGGKVPVAALPYREQWGEVDSAEDLATYEGWLRDIR
jgi:L-glutamine-phosphate cytidylyltransferase